MGMDLPRRWYHWKILTGKYQIRVGTPPHLHNKARQKSKLSTYVKYGRCRRIQVLFVYDIPRYMENKEGSVLTRDDITPS